MKKFIILALLIFPIIGFSAEPYKMNDLQQLAKSKSWLELTEHLSDIIPSERDTQWQELANLALLKRFQELDSAANFKFTLQFLDKIFPQYPLLINNKAFMALRGKFGIRYYESCFSYNNETCHRELLGFVKIDPNPQYAFFTAKQVRLRMSNNKAVEYFNLALSNNTSKEFCADKDLQLSVESALKAQPGSQYAIAANKVAFSQCFEHLSGVIKTAVKNNDNAKNNACKQLLARDALKGISKKKCVRFLKKQ